MNFEEELKRLAESYEDQGYKVVIHPAPEHLPAFAKDFKVEILGKRARGGVLVSVKKNRHEMEDDTNMPRYAEVTSGQPRWRYDFAILEAEEPGARELRDAQELTDEGIIRHLNDAQQLVQTGYLRPALGTAWAAFEATMRRRLRSSGEAADWRTSPRSMLNDLYSTGNLTVADLPSLEQVFRMSNEIAHGFASPSLNPDSVLLLIDTARRLLDECGPMRQTA